MGKFSSGGILFSLIVMASCHLNGPAGEGANGGENEDQALNYFDHQLQGDNLSANQLREIFAGQWEFFSPPETSDPTKSTEPVTLLGKIMVREQIASWGLPARLTIIWERTGTTDVGTTFTTTSQFVFENQQLVVESMRPGEQTVGKLQHRKMLIKMKNANGTTTETLYDFAVDGEITLSYRQKKNKEEAIEQSYLYAQRIK